MLPLLANQLHIAFGSKQLVFARIKGVTKRIIGQSQLAITSDDASYEAVLAQLDQHLSAQKYPVNTAVNVTLASEYVRYLVLPAQETLMSDAEKLAFANAAMQEVYGYQVNEWQLSCDDAPPGQPTIVAAVDQTLVAAMTALLEKYQLKLQSLQPYLVRAMNLLAKPIANQQAVMLIVEDQRILLIQLKQGVCHQVRQYVRSTNWVDVLPAWLGREQILSEHDTNTVLLYAPLDKSKVIQLTQPWQLKRVGVQHKQSVQHGMMEVAL